VFAFAYELSTANYELNNNLKYVYRWFDGKGNQSHDK